VDTEVVAGKSCSGDLDRSDSFEVFSFGVEGEYTEAAIPGLPSASTFEAMAWARLSSSYHITVDFDYDSFAGVPVAVQEVRAELSGAFEAGAGYRLNLAPQNREWPEQVLWNDDLGFVTVYIGPVPILLDFSGELRYKVSLEMEGGSMQSHAEVTVAKYAKVGLHFEAGDADMGLLVDTAPFTHTLAQVRKTPRWPRSWANLSLL
jgi:hypothetical protein